MLCAHMIVRVFSSALMGVEGVEVEVEVPLIEYRELVSDEEGEKSATAASMPLIF